MFIIIAPKQEIEFEPLTHQFFFVFSFLSRKIAPQNTLNIHKNSFKPNQNIKTKKTLIKHRTFWHLIKRTKACTDRAMAPAMGVHISKVNIPTDLTLHLMEYRLKLTHQTAQLTQNVMVTNK
jgi:hypothetical protein